MAIDDKLQERMDDFPLTDKVLDQIAARLDIDDNGKLNIAKFMVLTSVIESGGQLDAENPTSSASGMYQFIDGAVDPAIKRLRRYLPEEDWMGATMESNTPVDLNRDQQTAMFLANVAESRGTDALMKDIATTGSTESMKKLYVKGHYKGVPDEETEKVMQEVFNDAQDPNDPRFSGFNELFTSPPTLGEEVQETVQTQREATDVAEAAPETDRFNVLPSEVKQRPLQDLTMQDMTQQHMREQRTATDMREPLDTQVISPQGITHPEQAIPVEGGPMQNILANPKAAQALTSKLGTAVDELTTNPEAGNMTAMQWVNNLLKSATDAWNEGDSTFPADKEDKN